MNRCMTWLILGVMVGALSACATTPESQRAELDAAQRHYDVGVGALAENDVTKAVRELQLAVEGDPQNARNHHALGVAYLTGSETDRAIVELRRAVELNPRLADAYYNLGVAYMRQKTWDLAIASFQKALANPQYLNPERAHIYLGTIYNIRGQHDIAAQQFLKVIDMVPQSPDGYFFLGRTYLAQGKLGEAKEQIEKAIRIEGNIPAFYLELGRVQLRQGDRAGARESFRRVTELTPTGPEVEEARRLLRETN